MTRKDRPKSLNGMTYEIRTGCGYASITVNHDDNYRIQEIFAKLGKSGGCSSLNMNAVTYATSLAMQAGIPVEKFILFFRDQRCNAPTFESGVEILSCQDAVGRILEREEARLDIIRNAQVAAQDAPERPNTGEVVQLTA